MIKKDEILEVKVSDFANEGKSLARYDNFVIFIDNAVPEDIVEIKIYKVKKNFAFAKALKIITPSYLRVAPKCKYFGVCGGCKWQNLNYNSQLEFKRKSVIDALERIGNIPSPLVNAVIPSDSIYFFRNKMEFSFSDKRWLTEDEKNIPNKEDGFALGLHIPERFDKVLDITECFLQSELSTKILNFTRSFAKDNNLDAFSTKTHLGYLRNLVIREGKNTGQIMVNLVTSDDRPELMSKYSLQLLTVFPEITTIVNNITKRKSQVAVGDFETVSHGCGYIQEMVGKYNFQISPNSFFQTNTAGTEKLYNVVKNLIGEKKHKIIWDLYCGAGTISIYLSENAEKIFGFEIVEAAIKDAKINTEINKISNCTFISGDLKDCITDSSIPRPDLVILDPPRNGLHEDVLLYLLKILPEKIIYISCNPQTQARDFNILRNSYKPVIIQPVDMFPHTMHIENIISLEKISLREV